MATGAAPGATCSCLVSAERMCVPDAESGRGDRRTGLRPQEKGDITKTAAVPTTTGAKALARLVSTTAALAEEAAAEAATAIIDTAQAVAATLATATIGENLTSTKSERTEATITVTTKITSPTLNPAATIAIISTTRMNFASSPLARRGPFRQQHRLFLLSSCPMLNPAWVSLLNKLRLLQRRMKSLLGSSARLRSYLLSCRRFCGLSWEAQADRRARK